MVSSGRTLTLEAGRGDTPPPTIPTKSAHKRTPLGRCIWKQLYSRNSIDIGLSYILQRLNLRPDELKRRTSFTDSLEVTHLYGIPLHKVSFIEDLHAAAHIKESQVFFYSATTIKNNPILTTLSAPTPELRTKISSKEAVKAAVDSLGVPFYPDISPVKESYETKHGNILVWVFQLRDEPITQWLEVKVDVKTGDIVSKKDVKRGFTYTVVKLPNESPYDGG
ncbi:hypothetical protein BASA83_012335 [Batrachochytrium salamandrivorans]|nr:hypothetical protein BASA83_012335 [Batrachochytrium salamandrivorans]